MYSKNEKLIMIVSLLVASAGLMAVMCDYGSHNGPTNPTTPLDTTEITYLDSILKVTITFNVFEWDSTIPQWIPLMGASIHIINSDTTVLTDSAGYAAAFFTVDSTPYQYSFEVTKNGFEKRLVKNWAEGDSIHDGCGMHTENYVPKLKGRL